MWYLHKNVVWQLEWLQLNFSTELNENHHQQRKTKVTQLLRTFWQKLNHMEPISPLTTRNAIYVREIMYGSNETKSNEPIAVSHPIRMFCIYLQLQSGAGKIRLRIWLLSVGVSLLATGKAEGITGNRWNREVKNGAHRNWNERAGEAVEDKLQPESRQDSVLEVKASGHSQRSALTTIRSYFLFFLT